MSSFHPQPQHGAWIQGQPFQYSYDRGSYAYYDQYGASTSYAQAQPQSRTVSRPRVARACDHCRGRKVKCDGKKPSCDLCIRIADKGVVCTYSKVTPEENAKLREKKRLSKQRKEKEAEAARANFHKHDTFPAFHPYRNNSAVLAQPPSSSQSQQPQSHRSSFAASVFEDVHNQRNSFGAPLLPQTSHALYQSQPQPQVHAQGYPDAYSYDARYPQAPLPGNSNNTTSAANALFNVGAALNSGSRRASGVIGDTYARKPSFEANTTAAGITTAVVPWSRASEPRSSFSSSTTTTSYRYDSMVGDNNPNTTTTGNGGLNILNPIPTHNAPSYNYNSNNTGTFRNTVEQETRYMGAFAPASTSGPLQIDYHNASPPLTTPPTSTGNTGYFDHHQQQQREREHTATPTTGFRSTQSPFQHASTGQGQINSLSPLSSGASPGYFVELPALERANSAASGKGTDTSPETSPNGGEGRLALWQDDRSQKQYWHHQESSRNHYGQGWDCDSAANASGEEVVGSWTTCHNNSTKGSWDPVVSVYLQHSGNTHTPTAV